MRRPGSRRSAKKRMLIIDGMAHRCANFACSSDSESAESGWRRRDPREPGAPLAHRVICSQESSEPAAVKWAVELVPALGAGIR
jgi:hypothetical protein